MIMPKVEDDGMAYDVEEVAYWQEQITIRPLYARWDIHADVESVWNGVCEDDTIVEGKAVMMDRKAFPWTVYDMEVWM